MLGNSRNNTYNKCNRNVTDMQQKRNRNGTETEQKRNRDGTETEHPQKGIQVYKVSTT